MTIYQGKGVFPGIAFGVIHLLQRADAVEDTRTEDAEAEWARFLAAKAETDSQLETLYEKTRREIGEDEANIIDVQRMMLEDGDFLDEVERMIQEQHCSAPYAVTSVGKQFSALFATLEDPYMKARATDVHDMAQRLTDTLLGRRVSLQFTQPVIVVAEDLTPSETLQMDKSKIQAFVIRKGSSNSHTAILARMMNIPCIVQANIAPTTSLSGKEMIVDGEKGICYVEPDEQTLSEMRKRQQEEFAQKETLDRMRGLPTVTKGGKKLRLYSNIGSVDDLNAVLENDSEGIGLFRSEFLYLGRTDYPKEEELFEAYRKVAEGMGGKQVIIRTLDIGADKKVDYFKLDYEENPALGLRGVRVCIERPELFRRQLRAVYRASAFGNVAIMFPMITSLWEVRRCKELAAEVRSELTEEGVFIGEVEIGIMIETPAAVLIADSLAKEVNFFSVGTNDLIQYTLAIDRQNNKLDAFYDARHPAVLKMLRMIAHSAKENGIWAGICGELAADAGLTAELIEMGYEELSVSPVFTLEMRKRIREIG